MSSLSECISNANVSDLKEPKFRNVDFADGVWIKVVASVEGYYWVKNNQGALLTIAPQTAEKGWSLFLEKRTEKWCAWFNRPRNQAYHPAVEYKLESWVPADVAQWHRVEELDFTISVTE
jgi:hypothetical protein